MSYVAGIATYVFQHKTFSRNPATDSAWLYGAIAAGFMIDIEPGVTASGPLVRTNRSDVPPGTVLGDIAGVSFAYGPTSTTVSVQITKERPDVTVTGDSVPCTLAHAKEYVQAAMAQVDA